MVFLREYEKSVYRLEVENSTFIDIGNVLSYEVFGEMFVKILVVVVRVYLEYLMNFDNQNR